MKIEKFITKIHKGTYKTIEVERLKIVTGNTDNSGNYNIVKFKLGKEQGAKEIEFNNSSGTWTST